MLKKILRKIFAPSESFQITGRVRVFGRDKITGEIVNDTGWSKNLIMSGTNTGKNLILQRLIGTNSYSLNVLYADIGTGSTAPAITDTQITAASVRASLPATSISGSVATFQFFFADASLPNGTYYEIGTFVDGSTSVNTGQIFNHALFASAYTKNVGTDTTCQIDFTIS